MCEGPAGDTLVATSWSKLRDSFLSTPASLPSRSVVFEQMKVVCVSVGMDEEPRTSLSLLKCVCPSTSELVVWDLHEYASRFPSTV